ncbi:TPA: phosphoheptose isomerase [Patescibacteria group bacterium]|nr:MAG: Sugar isomerase (SIS) [Parcubacteria group bacterium GW2011_GWF2_40_10]KKR46909.1 MAG: Sugar isomerase (SIS) [Parcubacteria group bacterium GW2011_GWA2_40_143]KKR58896.1 MAG: Sugar isomerase (SIS) [Parcubacteria group bacterium GW2011_GWC2_40_31]KKR75183.1 MAG: Sugar isomerase (SIS) [Parcubacteria group bacterium GW2011_GWB2_40_8]KKR77739.1 MAG: Sugar isomerase (SIS) [Parcubacteria group bacterium GW2011_GWE2_40_8]KKR83291.1 MAG: Sugar isomerase (SIS) [Parcubacteria group bacterium GW2
MSVIDTNDTNEYLEKFVGSLKKTEVTDNVGNAVEFSKGIEKCVFLVKEFSERKGTLWFVGNGGSASIAGHQVTDFIRNGFKAMSPMDYSLITCMANDCGYEQVFSESLNILMEKTDLLITISSSGQSKNILNAAEIATKKGCEIITMSGFKFDNPLRKMGSVNFYAPSNSYRTVESAHLFFCNCILDFSLSS